jgi:hypothetical protein
LELEYIMKPLLIIAAVLGTILVLGFQIKPAPLEPVPYQTTRLETMPLPEGLPAPVERFYRTVYDENIPVIYSAVVTGRAQVTIAGVTMPTRIRFSYVAGQSYRHYIETTFFGLPIMRVNERYVYGVSRMHMPVGPIIEDDPKTNQAANLGMWAEFSLLPAMLLNDPRVEWKPVDDTTALLIVPFEKDSETFVVRFDSETGLMRYMQVMRYRASADEARTLWTTEAVKWDTIDGQMLSVVGSATWHDQGKPWAVFTIEDVVYNPDIADYMHAEGP